MAEDLVRQSVLDRLIGADLVYDGGSAQGRRPRTWEESVKLLERNVLRDMEQLLNARQISEPAEPPYEHLANSLYNYGLLDFANLSADAAGTAHEIRRLIKEAIERFEPRLMDVEVVDPEEDDPKAKSGSVTRRVRFRVEATLRTDPDPERVEFNTVLETTSKRFEVSAEPHA
jgi:type VI secretion system protein ImpF